MLIDRFITAYCDEDLSVIIKSGNPPTSEIEAAWNALRDEFEERLASDDYHEIQDLHKEINWYKTLYNSVKTIVMVLELMPVPVWIDHLQPDLEHWLGEPYPLDKQNRETLQMQLQGAMGIATRFLTEALAMEAQLPKAPKSEHAKKLSRENFEEIIINLSRYNRYKISKHETYTSEFCLMVQDMNRGIRAASQIHDN